MASSYTRKPWNEGKLIGPKPPLKQKDIWAIRIQLHDTHQVRDLAMFSLAINSKLRGCDLVNLRVGPLAQGGQVATPRWFVRKETKGPVRFELTERRRAAAPP